MSAPAFTSTYTVTVKYTNNTNQIETARESGSDAAATIALMKAKLKLLSGKGIISVTESQTLDPSTYALGHSDASEEANLELHDGTSQKDFAVRFDEMSASYADPNHRGWFKLTDPDVVAFVAALSAANGGRAYTILSGKYE